jgi:hypothetical protein
MPSKGLDGCSPAHMGLHVVVFVRQRLVRGNICSQQLHCVSRDPQLYLRRCHWKQHGVLHRLSDGVEVGQAGSQQVSMVLSLGLTDSAAAAC